VAANDPSGLAGVGLDNGSSFSLASAELEVGLFGFVESEGFGVYSGAPASERATTSRKSLSIPP
jgi:hypothetical protein